jgi:hypothetical protein
LKSWSDLVLTQGIVGRFGSNLGDRSLIEDQGSSFRRFTSRLEIGSICDCIVSSNLVNKLIQICFCNKYLNSFFGNLGVDVPDK